MSAGNSSFHCYDVAYARIHLYPVRNEDNGKWHFELSYNVGGYFRNVLNIVRALFEQGVVVGVCPGSNKYREEIAVPAESYE